MKLSRDQSAEDIAEIFDVHVKTVHQWCRDGCPHTMKGKAYRLNDTEVHHWLEETGRTAKPGRPKSQATTTADPEDSKDYWLARKYKTQCLREEGKLVDREAYRRAWMNQVATAKMAFLRLGAEVASSCVGQDSLTIDQLITARVEYILRELSDERASHAANIPPLENEDGPEKPR